MLHSTFASAVARGGSSGSSDYSKEFFNFPLTISSDPPSNPSQAIREGHVWLVMTQDQKNMLHNIVFDSYSQTVTYPAGTLVIIVPRFGNNRVYVNQTKNTGDSSTPLIYSTSDELDTLWPVTMVSDNQIQVRMEISKPWQYAKLITASSFDNIPLHYFNGTAWEAPRTWDYIYWSNLSDGTQWKAYSMNTETFKPIKENMPDFDLSPIVQTILASENVSVTTNISVIGKGGFAVLGLQYFPSDGTIKRNGMDIVQWWNYQPTWFFLKINKRGVSYLGRCKLTPYPNEYPFMAVAVRNSMANDMDYEATDFCVFLQTMSTETATYPNHIYFRRYYFDESTGTMKYTDSNKVSLSMGLLGASFDVNSRDSGFIVYHQYISKSTTNGNYNGTTYLAEFTVKDNVLTISEAKFTMNTMVYTWPYNNIFWMNVYDDIIYFAVAAGTLVNAKASCVVGRQPNRSLTQIAAAYNQQGYPINWAYPKFDKTDFVTLVSGNYNVYTINKSNPNGYTYSLTSSTTSQPANYQRDYYLSLFKKRIPGPRDDEFIWYPGYVVKQNPLNENQTLSVDQIGVSNMVNKSQCGSGMNMAIASLLKP